MFQSVAIAVVFVAMAVPLGFSLNRIVWETRSTQKIRSDVKNVFDDRSVVSNIDINWDADPIQISATVFTPQLKEDADSIAKRAITRDINRAVDVTLVQSRVGPDKSAAEAAQLAAARAQKEAAATQRAEELGERLALVAGVAPEDVTLDRDRRRALVTAQPLPGAGLAAYRELEQRISATEPDWQIRIKPPARALPSVAFSDGKPSSDGSDAIALIAWASARVGVPVVLEGRPEETAALAALLAERGIGSRSESSFRHPGSVTVRWGTPGG
jgi:hypothetical protein